MAYEFDKGGIARLAHTLLKNYAPRNKSAALAHLRRRLGVYDFGGHTLVSVVDRYFSKQPAS